MPCQPPTEQHQPMIMHRSKITRYMNANNLLAVIVLIACASGSAFAQTALRDNEHMNQGVEKLEGRGKYIVEDVAVCSQCHTPRDTMNRFDRTHWLQGAPVWLKSAEPVDNWPLQAPRIGGALPGTDVEMITLLTTGIWQTGTYLRPPMPQFRLSREDAEAVVAYLKSVQPETK
jgi:mono/diheme cytochrome c family protein